MADLTQIKLDTTEHTPIYRQLADGVRGLVENGLIQFGEKLPPTRELAGLLGLNRTTVSAAYALLEQEGLLQGHVGRGSFIIGGSSLGKARNWDSLLPTREENATAPKVDISFASSRPAQDAFPLDALRRLTKEVVDSPEAAQILQLGSPYGYLPLRRYLMDEARRAGIARAPDDLIITNGCQQALDLLARLFFHRETAGVALEDPVYHGLVRVFARAGAQIHSVPVDADGIDAGALEETLREHRPRMLVVTPSFQNPTGATLPLERRKRVVELAAKYDVVLVENDIYSELRYQGQPLPTLKELDETGNTILLRSYSKVSFPGLRVGWAIAPQPVVAHLADSKQLSDLHSDQLSQAVLLRFAESGELTKHLERTRVAGAERLEAVWQACARVMPPGTHWTRPAGGMSLWMELPAPLSAESLLRRAIVEGVDFLPGQYFSARRAHARGLRLSFGGLSPQEIAKGIEKLGSAARSELARQEPVMAMV